MKRAVMGIVSWTVMAVCVVSLLAINITHIHVFAENGVGGSVMDAATLPGDTVSGLGEHRQNNDEPESLWSVEASVLDGVSTDDGIEPNEIFEYDDDGLVVLPDKSDELLIEHEISPGFVFQPVVIDEPKIIGNEVMSYFYCPAIEPVPDYPGCYQSSAGSQYLLLSGGTDGLEDYIGESVLVIGSVQGINLSLDALYKHVPVFVFSYVAGEDATTFLPEDTEYFGEHITLTGNITLQTSDRLILESLERGRVLIQTKYSDFNGENYSHQASFSGYLFPILDPDCGYLLVADGYTMLDYAPALGEYNIPGEHEFSDFPSAGVFE
jgi:hypothetical protein